MEDAEAAARVGQTVAGKYRLERLLGAGGMGAVYLAEHSFTKRKVAVKLMHSELARNPMAAERFIRESRAPSSIGHPGIVEVLDGGHDEDGSLYLVLELLEGLTLEQAHQDGEVDVERAVDVACELLDALGAAHDAGFTHRDIKPENIFLTAQGEGQGVKLLDFGVAGTLNQERDSNLTHTGAILGTPRYMSPEQAQGKRADHRADIYAVGAVLYHLLAGRPVHQGKSYNEVIISIATADHQPITTLKPDLEGPLAAVIERALQKDPRRRFQHASDMANALQAAAEGKAMVVPDPPDATGDTAIARPSQRARAEARPAARPPKPTARQPPPAATGSGAAHPPAAMRSAGGGGPSLASIGLLGLLALVALGLLGAWRMGQRSARDEFDRPSHTARALQPEARPDKAQAAEEPAVEREPSPEAVPEAPTEPDQAVADREEPPEPTQPTARRAQPPGLTGEQIEATMLRNERQVQACYQDVLGDLLAAGTPPEQLTVKLEVEFTVRPTGRTSTVQVQGTAPPGVRNCIQRSIGGWQFPATNGETPVRFPLVLSPTIVGR